MDDLDREIFEAGEVAPPTPGPAVDESTAVRDTIKSLQREGGRESPSAPAREPPPAAPQQPSHGVEDQSPSGLLKGMLDERFRRQDLERQLERYQRLEQEQQRRQQENETPFDQRFFSQPQQELESLFQQKLTPYEQRLQNFMTDVDMRMARQQHGEAFDEAFHAWFQQVGDLSRPDPQTYFAVMSAPSPGEALMQWFDSRPERMRAKIEAEVLAQYGLTPNATSPPPHERVDRNAENGQFTPRHEVRLPTSLSRMGAAGRGTPPPVEDGSEEAIFDAGRPERRR